ncbi:hypothetical protein T459_34283 [Capsicum annuum]|uniref:Cyclin N-terminal domain-containing protein n=1 Tax=Capsicum annuum TaxID=4072 RepID=A0A2G2XWG6_CAPAN|nr:hypothetical protein T459_34283 [Capsicum annuum]
MKLLQWCPESFSTWDSGCCNLALASPTVQARGIFQGHDDTVDDVQFCPSSYTTRGMYDVFVNFIKAACGLSKKSKEQIVDIDAADVNYELAVLEYVEDIYSFYKLAELNDFVCISDKTYSHEQVLTMEKQIHEQLEWYLTVPTPYVFLVRSIKASLPDSETQGADETTTFKDIKLNFVFQLRRPWNKELISFGNLRISWTTILCWSTYLQLLHPSGNNSGNLCTSMLHCVKLVVVDKVAVVGEVKLAMWNPHCLPISRLLLQADELIPMDSTVSGYATTSLFSKAVWVSINPLLSTGYQSPLKLDEVPLLPPDFQAEFRLCSMRLMKLPKMLNQTWSIMPELRSSLPHSRQGNTTNKNKQKLHVVLPSPASTSQVHNGSNHAKVCTQQEKLNSSLELLTNGNISTLARCKEISSPIYIQIISFREGMRLFGHLCTKQN